MDRTAGLFALRKPRQRFTSVAALAGLIGPLLLGGTIIGLTIAQYEFMRRLRWHPIDAPTTDWPSGLALGAYGNLLIGAFIVCGFLLIVFALGLYHVFQRTERLSLYLLGIAGLALMALAFKVDPTYRDTPRTWHGDVHDAAYVVLGLSLLPAMLLLARTFRSDPRWRGFAPFTIATLLLIVPAFVFKGLLFYLFLIGILLWIELVALRLWQLSKELT